MTREMNYLEEFLFSAQDKIENLKVTTEPSDTDNYKYLIVDFEEMTYKINKDLVFNFCNIYQKLNKDELDAVEVEVHPFSNLGSVKEKNLEIDSSIIQTEDEVSELVEKIVSKIYEKFNFLILPATEDDIDYIDINDYVLSAYDSASEQAKSQGQNLYSIGFKVRVECEKETEYIPFKVYFRIFEKKANELSEPEIGISIAEEFNSLAKADKINILTARKFSQREKNSLKKKFENHEFEADKEKISSNIEKIINQILMHISNYVSKFDESPDWFKDSELGKFIKNSMIKYEKPVINATASFRYITQTPLPYSYIDVKFRNTFNTNIYQIKKCSTKNKELNETLNLCPMCKRPITSSNKLVASNQYVDEFVGCEKCMTVKCSVCDSAWSKDKKPTPINRKVGGKYYYMAGSCNASFVSSEYLGMNLCAIHAKKCFNPLCEGNVYSPLMIEKCSNIDCDKTYCFEHAGADLYKCEATPCSQSQNPNKYCSSCKDRFLNTCSFCGNTMCQSCSRPVLKQNGLGNFEFATDEFICVDCYEAIVSGKNLDVNKINKAVLQQEDKKYYPKAVEYLKLYGDLPDQFIDNSIAYLAYKKTKPEDYKEDSSKGKLYYRETEVTKCDCCKEFFKYTRTIKNNKAKNYCEDCLVKCSMCNETVVITDVINYDGKNYCKHCYKDKWVISDLSLENVKINEPKDKVIKTIFDNPNNHTYNVLPINRKDVFLCPETGLKIAGSQTKVCSSCKEKYSITNFNQDSDICKLCEDLDNFDYNKNKDLLIKAFYNKNFGDISNFKVCLTKNTLLIRHADLLSDRDNLLLYKYNPKKGKYVVKSVIKDTDEKEGEVEDGR